MKANGKRVISRLEEIYQCGKKEDGTYTRMAFSDEDVKGRKLFASWAETLGMTTRRVISLPVWTGRITVSR